MAANITSDTYVFTSSSAVNGAAGSAIVFNPNIPAGASIGQCFVDVLSATGSPLGQASVSFTNLVDGNQVTVTEQNLTGVLTTAAKAVVSSLAWTNTSPDGLASVTVVTSASVTSGYQGIVQYLVSYD